MKGTLILILLGGAGYLGWQAGGYLSSDAMGMAAGIFFGAVAGIPTALLALAGGRRRAKRATRRSPRRAANALPAYAPQPPVIVLAGPGMAGGANQAQLGMNNLGGWGASGPERRFKVVGEQEAWIDEW